MDIVKRPSHSVSLDEVVCINGLPVYAIHITADPELADGYRICFVLTDKTNLILEGYKSPQMRDVFNQLLEAMDSVSASETGKQKP